MKSKIVLNSLILEKESTEALPRNLVEMIAYLQHKVDEIDSDFQNSMTIDFENEDDGYMAYGCAYEINYSRPETDEETKFRIQREAARKGIDRTQKLIQYNKLQKELGLGDK